ncbi:hypothetical protein R1CP_23610 [Rhodococcus opacus]|uniref:DUF2510 domain-containing protein n=1 Tax=Rhodococcus opacus TaxID=37919 RepID=A0A1B1K9U6_RHOOP|nr:DUF2510 domain-containing protein [Rhodococcus opacus]ANS29390.1 hypothetical protein R1CP_23610 [Rhodococcus opacus]
MTTTHTGFSCEATLDVDAGTVTLVHSGIAAKAHKKDASPRVIPLGAIESVDFAKTNIARRGWVRFLLRGGSGYHQQVIEDVNGYLLKGMKDNTAEPFVDAVRKAMETATPVDGYGAAGTADETRPGMLERTDNFIAKLDAKSAELEAIKARNFLGLSIKSDTLAYKGQTFPIAGAKATIESAGIAQSRMTATRVIGGAALFGGTGAVIGAVGRKDKSKIFLTIELADGTVLVEEFPVKKEGDARRFVAQFNTTAARTRQPAPTPQPVAQTPQPAPQVDTPAPAPVIAQGPPPGWYADPHGTPNTRWWDGTTWTEHLQPTIQP